MSDDFRALVADGFTEAGLSAEASNRLADFTDAITRVRVAGELSRLLERLRPTVAGTALLRVLVDDAEPLREAARRLHISPAGLLKTEARFRELVNTPANLEL